MSTLLQRMRKIVASMTKLSLLAIEEKWLLK